MSLISIRRCLPAPWIRLRSGMKSSWPTSSASSISISLYPIIAFIGVRSSWLIFARKELFVRLAPSASSRAASASIRASSAFCSASARAAVRSEMVDSRPWLSSSRRCSRAFTCPAMSMKPCARKPRSSRRRAVLVRVSGLKEPFSISVVERERRASGRRTERRTSPIMTPVRIRPKSARRPVLMERSLSGSTICATGKLRTTFQPVFGDVSQ